MKKSLCMLLVVAMLFSILIGTAVSSSAAAFTIQRQWDSKWKSYYVGGRTMYDTACGIFSMVNAIGYLTGDAPDVYQAAKWANSIGAFNAGFGGTDRSALYPKIQKKYGATYGFTCDVAGGSGYWATAASSTLKNHLAKGGVAIGHVPGHFIAIVGYDSSTNKFHVYDSAPSSTRGTNTYGATGLGDCWVTQSRLSTGKLKLDWFCLLTATKSTPVVTVDKTQLQSLMNSAAKVSHKNYDKTNLQTLRVAYDAGTTVLNNSSATQEQVNSARTTLLNALLNTSAKTVLSTGKSYTVTNNARTDDYKDDGIVLTDGAKGQTDGGNLGYAGFTGSTEIVVDLSSVQKTDTYTAYLCAGQWGIYVPDDFYLDVYVSTDNSTYTKAASTSAPILSNGSGIDGSTWSTYRFIATSDKQLEARYVKFVLKNYDRSHSQVIWVDEVEVARYTGSHITDAMYVSGVNSKVYAGQTKIFTPSFNNGKVSAAADAANLLWTRNVVLRAKGDGSYTVIKSEAGEGDASVTYTLAADEILIASHAWEVGADDPIGDSGDNFKKISALQPGDSIYLSGVNIQYAFINIGAYITTSAANSGDSVGNEGFVEQLVGGKTFWLTHYNNNTAEGSGVIFTEAYSGGAWWLHIAFAPTTVDRVYQVTAISDGTDIGDATALSIPEGGFVYAMNYGNNYPAINADGSGTDYTSSNCTSAIIDALTWKVGDQLKISGLDFGSKNIPTTTPTVKWYEDAYRCSANYVMYYSNSVEPEYDTTVYENSLWVTHYNTLLEEGAGAIVTDSSVTGSVWNNYYAFEPVSGSNEYKLVAMSLGASQGTGVMPSIPNGGFVYAINPGNDYPTLNSTGDTKGLYPDLPDYTSESCSDMLVTASSWKIGDTFVFGNLDLKGHTIPTSTATLKWYQSGYVCTSTFERTNVIEEDEPVVDPVSIGDVNLDGNIDQYDYILVKRHYFETRLLTEDELTRADVNADTKVDQYDYILICRHYFGTYKIG